MSQVKEKIFYDSPPEKKWCFTGEALFIKNTEHRKILNVRSEFIYGPAQYVRIKNIEFRDFDIWVKVMSN